jgi:hypothetical protein
MDRADMPGHQAGMFEIRGARHTNAVGVEALTASAGKKTRGESRN